MRSVGAYEAKTHLSQLLDCVAKGERIVIEKHGVPVATLQPAVCCKRESICDVITALRDLRTGKRLDGISIREMIEEGRR